MNSPADTPHRTGRLSQATLDRFAREVAKFPGEQKQSAVMACLSIVQQEAGWVSREAEDEIAAYLGMAPIAVYEVTTFYNMYNQQPVGRWKLNVCTNLPCQLRGGEQALQHLCSRLGVEEGGTSADGLFTIEGYECIAACTEAPCLQVNYRYFENVTPARFDAIVDDLRAGRDPEGQSIPPHGTLSRVALPVPVTAADRERPEEIS